MMFHLGQLNCSCCDCADMQPTLLLLQQQQQLLFSHVCPQECVMGLSMLFFLVGLKMLSKRVKKLHWIGAMGPILACAIGIAAVAAGNLSKRGIKIVEKIPQGRDRPAATGARGRSWETVCGPVVVLVCAEGIGMTVLIGGLGQLVGWHSWLAGTVGRHSGCSSQAAADL
jgi:hypothetical protein